MREFKFRVVITIFIILIFSINAFKAQGVRTRGQNKGKRDSLPVSYYLGKVAMKYNCSLTYEEAWEDGESRNQMEAYPIPLISDNKDLQQELEYVRHIVPFI